MSTNEEVLQKLPNEVVREALLDIVRKNIPAKNFKLKIEEGSSKGDNYVGIVHRITITYNDDKNENSTNSIMKVFVKVPPDNLERRNQFSIRPCFLREALMYDEYLPLLAKFQQAKKINMQRDGFKEYAKCYKTVTKDLTEAIFMEDLALKGFRMHDRFVAPSLDIVKLIMKALGKLHALSFALKDQWPDQFSKFKDIKEIFRREDNFFIDYMNQLSEVCCDALSNQGDEKYLEIFKSNVHKKPLYKSLMELLEGTSAEPYAVICHGDCWNNNILFKYENEKAVDIKMIDYQLSRYASPACDLSYYIFSCTTKSFRDQYMQEILNVYYSELVQLMQMLGSDASILFPRSALDDQFKRFGFFGLIMGLLTIPIITKTAENAPDLDLLSKKMEAGDLEFTKNLLGNKVPETFVRIRDVAVDVINLGCLNW